MENGSFSSPEFASFSKSVVPFLHVQANIEGRENDSMLGLYGGRGFPTLRFLDASGEAVATPAGRSVESFNKTSMALTAVADLKAQIKEGKKGLGPKLLIAEMELGSVKFEDAKKRVASFKKLRPGVKAKLDGLLINAEVDSITGSMTRDNQEEIMGKLVKMAKAGKIPTGDSADQFWQMVAGWADENADATLMQKGYDHLFKKYGKDERAAKYFEKMKERMAEIKKGAKPDA